MGQGRIRLHCIHYPAHPVDHSWILAHSRCGHNLEDTTWLGNHRVQLGLYESASKHGPSQGSWILQSGALFKAQFSASFLSNDRGKQRRLFAQADNFRKTRACSQAV